MLSFLNSWMLSFSIVEDVILFYGVNVIIFEGLEIIIFHGVPYMLSFLKHWVLSLGVIIYFMLSFDVIISHSLQMLSFCVIIFPCTGWVLSFMLSFNVIIFCYHFPPFSFSWKRDTLVCYWRIKPVMALGCRTVPPSYIGWQACTATRRQSRLHPPSQGLRIRPLDLKDTPSEATKTHVDKPLFLSVLNTPGLTGFHATVRICTYLVEARKNEKPI